MLRLAEEGSIEIGLRCGGMTVKLTWPMSASMDLSAWMRTFLDDGYPPINNN